jgi:predicted nucleic acid-binding protein
MISCDTSFLYSLYVVDTHTPEARARLQVTGGHRAFDILHVAAAVYLGADEFLTFDSNQRS